MFRHLLSKCIHADSFCKELRLWFLHVAYIGISLDLFDICLIKKVLNIQVVLKLIITLLKGIFIIKGYSKNTSGFFLVGT